MAYHSAERETERAAEKIRKTRWQGGVRINPALILTPDSASSSFFLSFLSSPPADIMSREGINPLRPYYIPSSGLSPANANAPPEVTSASSAQVFGASARDLISDLPYADYLDSSPSVTDWVRDVLNRALVRYSKVLMAQPVDVAKTILQVYVVPDADQQWDSDRRSTPGTRASLYDSVWP